jgi:16S rRNA processing protein RimM
MLPPANLIDMGYISAAFGIKGWVKIKVASSTAENFATYAQIYLKLPSGAVIAHTIEQSFIKDGVVHAKLSQVEDRDSAGALTGATLAIAREEFPRLSPDEYYWVDLIGMSVITIQDELLGVVSELLETGANDVLVVKDEKLTQHLIPFVAQYVKAVNYEAKQIKVEWGLDY